MLQVGFAHVSADLENFGAGSEPHNIGTEAAFLGKAL